MTLPVSPNSISLSQVNTELGLPATANISMLNANVRSLFGQATGAVDMNTGRGKSNGLLNSIINARFFNYSYQCGNTYSPSYCDAYCLGFNSLTIPNTYGSMTNVNFNGVNIVELYQDHDGIFPSTSYPGSFVFTVSTTVPKNFFNSLSVNGHLFNSTNAIYNTFTYDGKPYTRWLWNPGYFVFNLVDNINYPVVIL